MNPADMEPGCASGASTQVQPTRLGGGAFGNRRARLDGAILRALALAAGRGIDVLQVQR